MYIIIFYLLALIAIILTIYSTAKAVLFFRTRTFKKIYFCYLLILDFTRITIHYRVMSILLENMMKKVVRILF